MSDKTTIDNALLIATLTRELAELTARVKRLEKKVGKS